MAPVAVRFIVVVVVVVVVEMSRLVVRGDKSSSVAIPHGCLGAAKGIINGGKKGDASIRDSAVAGQGVEPGRANCA